MVKFVVTTAILFDSLSIAIPNSFSIEWVFISALPIASRKESKFPISGRIALTPTRLNIFDAVVASNYFRDLYISFRNPDDSWTQAVSMGDAVNTSENEMCAFVSRNGEYLFFYRGGEGSDGVYWVDADIIEDLK